MRNLQENDFSEQRREMVHGQLMARDIYSEKVIKAFLSVRRELFVPEESREHAYRDFPLGIGFGQTISQPYIVALMTQAADVFEGSKILEIGSGSGYQAAILAYMGAEVYSVERIQGLKELAERNCGKAGFPAVKFKIGDGSLGWPEYAPYDIVIVTAASPHIPGELVNQLKENGRMVIPVGGSAVQDLLLARKKDNNIIKQKLCGCRFVPLIGEDAWKD
ncbi:protein-L-isoaspartate(D-aspartate) O-methyltransferase [bacterium]|jgi:protein-L-isoaspartate(D-aspartate) O-methyltransferase|nr:protein-L-isoaspartate(D-aspartate) O-methyltransferase [bacterium]